MRQQGTSHCEELREQSSIPTYERLRFLQIAARASCHQLVEAVKPDLKPSSLQGCQDVAPAMPGSHLKGVAAIECIGQSRIGAVVEQGFDHYKAVVTTNGLQK